MPDRESADDQSIENTLGEFPKKPQSAHRSTWHQRHRETLTLGQRAADAMRNGMGSWTFVGAALVFLVVWIWSNGLGVDLFPWILLNLLLSCVAALQGAILLIAAKRADEVAAVLAHNDAEVNLSSEERIEDLQIRIARLENVKHNEILRELRELGEKLGIR